ncbi:DinB family protein [Kordia sp.]|uniref:DinB family protein n=1 Tax=Kordia sp. TaxID=1965332 RepID=UPI003B5AF9BB
MEQKTKTIELVRYNLWANKRLISWLKDNDDELMSKKCASSFSSILQTLDHMIDGQLFYYAALKEIPIEKPWNNSLEKIYKGLIEQSSDFVTYVEHQDTFEDSRLIRINRLKGNFPQFEIIQHCMNHSTFHRGQVITIGHQLLLTKAPSTDMLFYFIERNKH